MRSAKTPRFLMKTAKETAFDKAMVSAAKAGKPTTTGIVAGAGLGSVLAALGALSRSDGESDHSILSNPLLLGGLGAAGGYLAGNSLDSIKPEAPKSTLTGTLAGLPLAALGVGTLGSTIAKNDAGLELGHSRSIRDKFRRILASQGKDVPGEPKPPKCKKGKKRQLKSLTSSEKETLVKLDQRYMKDLMRNGEYDAAEALRKELGLSPLTKFERTMSKLKYSPYSPVQQLKALNILPKGFGGKVLDVGLNAKREYLSTGGALGQIRRAITENGTVGAGVTGPVKYLRKAITVPRLGALAALAGIGKFTHDKIRERDR